MRGDHGPDVEKLSDCAGRWAGGARRYKGLGVRGSGGPEIQNPGEKIQECGSAEDHGWEG